MISRLKLIAEGEKQELIKHAEGKAFEIATVADATAAGIAAVAKSIGEKDGLEAVNLRVAEKYIKEFGNIAKQGNTLIIPSNMADVGGVAATLMSVIKQHQMIRVNKGISTNGNQVIPLDSTI